VGFVVTDQLLITFSAFDTREKRSTMRQYSSWVMYISYLFTDFKKAYDTVRKKALYNNLIVFGVHMKLVSLFKCVYIKHIVKYVYVNN
jgi:hypothetical protein